MESFSYAIAGGTRLGMRIGLSRDPGWPQLRAGVGSIYTPITAGLTSTIRSFSFDGVVCTVRNRQSLHSLVYTPAAVLLKSGAGILMPGRFVGNKSLGARY